MRICCLHRLFERYSPSTFLVLAHDQNSGCGTEADLSGALRAIKLPIEKAVAGTGVNGYWADITSDIETGIDKCSKKISDIVKISMLPNGDFTEGAMAEVTQTWLS